MSHIEPIHQETVKIEMCEFYDVWHHPHNLCMGHPICNKRRYWMVGLKCHSERKDCPDYKPSEAKDAIS